MGSLQRSPDLLTAGLGALLLREGTGEGRATEGKGIGKKESKNTLYQFLPTPLD